MIPGVVAASSHPNTGGNTPSSTTMTFTTQTYAVNGATELITNILSDDSDYGYTFDPSSISGAGFVNANVDDAAKFIGDTATLLTDGATIFCQFSFSNSTDTLEFDFYEATFATTIAVVLPHQSQGSSSLDDFVNPTVNFSGFTSATHKVCITISGASVIVTKDGADVATLSPAAMPVAWTTANFGMNGFSSTVAIAAINITAPLSQSEREALTA